MTKISPEIDDKMQAEVILPVSADASFFSDSFPQYKLGPDNQILEEPKEDNNGPSLKDVVEKETMQLSDQHKRLSVRDLASKFDKNLAAAAKLSEEVTELCHYFIWIWILSNFLFSCAIKHNSTKEVDAYSSIYQDLDDSAII